MEEAQLTPSLAYENLCIFAQCWGKKYPGLNRLAVPRNVAYCTYLNFPQEVRRMIYSSNWVERLNREYKRTLKIRGAAPSADSVLYLPEAVAFGKTQGCYAKRIHNFREWKQS